MSTNSDGQEDGLKNFLDEFVFAWTHPSRIERMCRINIRETAMDRIKILLMSYVFINLVIWPTDFLIFQDPDIINAFIYLRVSSISLSIVYYYLIQRMDDVLNRWRNRPQLIWGFIVGAAMLFGSVGYTLGTVQPFDSPTLSILFSIPVVTVVIPLDLIPRFFATILISAPYGIAYVLSTFNVPQGYQYEKLIFMSGATILLNTLIGHSLFLLDRKNFFKDRQLKKTQIEATEAKKKAEAENEKSEQLLLNILPEKISDRMKEGEDVAEQYENVTVLFADIVDFTPIANELSATEVVSLLDEIFSSFDGRVNEHGLEKIKTIGDEYFVAAGVPESVDKHAVKMARFAFDLNNEIRSYSRRDGSPFKLRIGMNTGPLVAGIIGNEKFVYDVWGETVNLGSRMESEAKPGEIRVTPSTKEAIQAQANDSEFEFELRNEIDIKGKGTMDTYQLKLKRDNG